MKAHELKASVMDTKYFIHGKQINPAGFVLHAWVDLRDCYIYHSINGEVMALVFPNLDAFANYIEQMSELQP